MAMRWRMLALIFLTRTAMGFQFQSIAALAPELGDSLGFVLAEIGTLIGVYMLPGIVVAIPGGALGNRFGAKPIVLAALGLMAAGGGLAALADGFTLLFVARLVAGIGSVLFSVLATKMVADWFFGKEIIAGMAVMLSSWPFGLALALLIQAAMARVIGWQGVMLSTGAFCVLSLVLVACFYRDPPDVAAAPVARFSALTRYEAGMASLAGGIWMTFNVGFLAFFSFVPTLLVARGASAEAAGALASLGMWGSLVTVAFGGVVTQWIGRANLSIVFGGLLGFGALAWLAAGGDPITGGLLVAISAICAGAIVALPAEALRANTRAAGLGIFYAWFYLGMAGGPALAGWIGDRTGDVAAPVWVGAVMYLVGPALLAAFRMLQRPVVSRVAP
jgi:predicted MFS family arabinose efflux permease